ncbi:MAG: hypothetical protein IJ339_03140 [Oscillospiraceae bacterium]|nr:hypothetical protein [Oscillospiraceae bacterium]MBQ7816341.1 hypothetical protein [Oscillospiraceae bacterium]
MTCDQKNCRDFLQQNSRKFGITDTNLGKECLDICARNVRCIASRRIDEKIVLPSMSNFLNSCTGLVDCAGGIDTQFASLRVTHAKEELVDCDTNCPGVQVTIKGQIIVRTRSCNANCPPSYMAIPVELVSEVIRDFYSTADGQRVAQLHNELPNIDGSCMVINLNCRVYREVCNGCSRYVAHIRGSVVDKLWKLENIWVEGIRPYPAPSITICDRFDKDICTCFEDNDYIRMNAQRVTEDGYICCDNECDGCGNNGCGCVNNGCDDNCNCGCDDSCGCGSGCNVWDSCCDDNCGHNHHKAARGTYGYTKPNCYGYTANGCGGYANCNDCCDCDDDCCDEE